jgi:tripartite-type tricarboxylate transporter receptor subunit TctC
MIRSGSARACALAFIGVIAAAGAAHAQSVEEFYKGKRVKMIVGGSPGGGYDTYARAFARYYKNYIPGKPSIIAQNMQGAGGIRATNYIASGVVPRDGSVFATSLRTVATEPLFHPKATKYDATKLNWLGSLANEISICVTWHTSPVKTFADAQKQEVIMGASNGNSTEFYPAIFNNLLGTKFKIVVGYVAVGINVAMERGEVAGRCSWSWSSLMSQRPDWVRDKKINILVLISDRPSPHVPKDVPLIYDFAKSKEDKQLLDLFFLPQTMGRPYFLPPDVPADRVKAMRTAFDQAVKDPKLASDFKRLHLELSPISGTEIQDMLGKLYANTPPEMVASARDAMIYKGKKQVAKIKLVKVKASIVKVNRGGRRLDLKLADGKMSKTSVSSRRTKVMIDGKKAKRSALKAGMNCTVEWPGPGQRAKTLDCK